MRKLFFSLIATSIICVLSSCEKDEGKLPAIKFKTGGSYTSADATLPAKSILTIGIDAEKTEDKDGLKKFNISKSINGGASTSLYDDTLDNLDTYSYDYIATMDTVVGQVNTYTFTVTNRDGLMNQVSLKVTVK